MTASARTTLLITGWILVISLSLVAMASVLDRGTMTTRILAGVDSAEESRNDFEQRYADHPGLALVHVVPGGIFMLLGPIQFIPSIRRRWPTLHRWMGRVYLVASVVLIVTAYLFAAILPVYGTLTATVGVLVGNTAFAVCIVQAFRAIRRRQIPRHREWMIRAYALGLGIATFRVLIPVLMMLPIGATFAEAWDTVAWLGFIINSVVAEFWIQSTRPASTR